MNPASSSSSSSHVIPVGTQFLIEEIRRLSFEVAALKTCAFTTHAAEISNTAIAAPFHLRTAFTVDVLERRRDIARILAHVLQRSRKTKMCAGSGGFLRYRKDTPFSSKFLFSDKKKRF